MCGFSQPLCWATAALSDYLVTDWAGHSTDNTRWLTQPTLLFDSFQFLKDFENVCAIIFTYRVLWCVCHPGKSKVASPISLLYLCLVFKRTGTPASIASDLFWGPNLEVPLVTGKLTPQLFHIEFLEILWMFLLTWT